MDLMGWSQLSMAQRYQHVPDELRRDVADKLGRLLWVAVDGEDNSGAGAPGAPPVRERTETQSET